MPDIFDQIAEETVGGSKMSAPDIFDQIAEQAINQEDLISKANKVQKGLTKGLTKGALSLITGPADLLYRGGNYLANKITGNEVSPVGGYPSDYTNKAVDFLFGNEGSKTAETIGNIGGSISTLGAASIPSLATTAPKLASNAPSAVRGLLSLLGASAEGAGWGLAFNPKSEDLVKEAKTGAVLGAGIRAAQPVFSKIASTADDASTGLKNILFANKPSKADRIRLVDEAGNIVRDPSKAVAEISQKDLYLKDLEKGDFFKKIPTTTDPKKASLALREFSEELKPKLTQATNTMIDLEKSFLSNKAPQEAYTYIKEGSPNFQSLIDDLEGLQRIKAPGVSGVRRTLNGIIKTWEDSDQSFAALKDLQQTTGKALYKKGGVLTESETKAKEFADKAYAQISSALERRANILDPNLGAQFNSINKPFVAAKNLQTDLSYSTRKGVNIPVLEKIPGVSSVSGMIADKTLIPLTKGLGSVEKAANLLSKTNLTPGLIQTYSKLSEKKTFPEKLDMAILKAEKQMSKEENKEAAPMVLSAKRVPTEQAHRLVPAVIQQESSKDPNAVSELGAQGLMQLMPETGQELFKKAGLSGKYNPFNPEQNITLGTMYLQELLDMFKGDAELALTAYHSGPNRVKRLLRIHKASTLDEIKPHLGPVGREYANQVLSRLRKLGFTRA